MTPAIQPWAEVLWIAIGLGLMIYALSAGADFGAGVWSLLARGPRKAEQREAIQHALAPIWEANHVWLIFVIVLMFSAFPRAFAVISIALHIPIALALVGIVLRGAAFSFHAYGIQSDGTRERWSRLFAWSSAVTPLFLGSVVAGVSTGAIHSSGNLVESGWFAGWTSPFALLVGLFALVLFALLSATYLAAETAGALADDFRRRALVSEVVAGMLALLVLVAARSSAPRLFAGLSASIWTWPVQIATAGFAAATLTLLLRRNHRLARLTVAAQIALVVVGWGLAMDHHFVLPDLSIHNAGAEPRVLPALCAALAAGSLLLAPALFYLYRVFKLER